MTGQVRLTQSTFKRDGPAGFAVAYLKDRGTVPVVGLATVDFGTDDEDRVELRAGEPFQVAGQMWQISEIRNPTTPDWVVVLQRIDVAT
jgi:Family of unknown function (DUF6406)